MFQTFLAVILPWQILVFMILSYIAMVDSITIHDLLLMSQCFQQKNSNTFDVLTFLQVRTNKNKDKMGAYK